MAPAKAAANPIPDSANLIAQYLLLYSFARPDPLNSFVDTDYRDAVVLSFSRTDAAAVADELFQRTRTFVAERFAGLPVSVGVAGGSLGAQAAMNAVVVREKLINMMQVAGIIFLLSSLVLRSLLGGALVLAPLLAALGIMLGLMGWTNTWLSISTSVILAMGLGIGADFAVYLIFRLREELRTAPLAPAMRRALNTSGKAVFFVSSAVSLGFLVLATSSFVLWFQLGSFIALMMALSSLASLTLLPPLIMLLRPRFLVGRPEAEMPKPEAQAAFGHRAEAG
jgi:predicted RND superfamily exporter protein